MKKSILFCLLLASSAFAQDANIENPLAIMRGQDFERFWYFSSDHDAYFEYAPRQKRREIGVKKIKQTYISAKGKRNTIEMEFNPAGKLIHTLNPSRKYEFTAQYENDTLEVYRSQKSKKELVEVKRSYNNGKKTSEEKIVDGKQKYLLNITYLPDGKISESSVTNKKGLHRMLYEYTPDGKLVKNTYLRNGKIEKVWNYECKNQGELVASTKNEIISSKCEYREESSDGSFVVYERTLQKGKPYLTEKKFTKDSVAYEINYYVNDSIISSSWKQEGDWSIDTYYKKKGKVRSQYKNRSNSDHKTLEFQYFHKNKMLSRTVYSYDQAGNCTRKESFNPKKAQAVRVRIREFNPDGTMKHEKAYHKGKVSYEQEYEYSF